MLDDFSTPLSYFSKRAKKLRTGVQAGDADALARVRSVFNDAASESDQAVIAGFGLMRAQHVVAVEHGFVHWKALTEEVAPPRVSPDRDLKRFTLRAVEILAKRGIRVYPAEQRLIGHLVWLDAGGIRTLRISDYSTTPFVVRLSIDHFAFFVSQRVAEALGAYRGDYTDVRPSRPGAEISILPDEVDAALGWALNFDARTGLQPPPPPFEPVQFDRWHYMWSKRAEAKYDAAHKKDEAA
jgi:hypothetical protein